MSGTVTAIKAEDRVIEVQTKGPFQGTFDWVNVRVPTGTTIKLDGQSADFDSFETDQSVNVTYDKTTMIASKVDIKAAGLGSKTDPTASTSKSGALGIETPQWATLQLADNRKLTGRLLEMEPSGVRITANAGSKAARLHDLQPNEVNAVLTRDDLYVRAADNSFVSVMGYYAFDRSTEAFILVGGVVDPNSWTTSFVSPTGVLAT